MTAEPARAHTTARSGNDLTLNGANALFDFNTGVFEEAKLYLTLVRQ